eukprot:5250251-Lingulodinium_polyedra.AAC.1
MSSGQPLPTLPPQLRRRWKTQPALRRKTGASGAAASHGRSWRPASGHGQRPARRIHLRRSPGLNQGCA